jgi:PAS domain S-box-containing protein
MNPSESSGEEAQVEVGEALRQSEERFRILVESVQDYAIFMLDARGHVISWNLGAKRLKGYDESEIVGRHFSTFYRLEDIAEGRPARLLHEALTRGSTSDEGWRVRNDGSEFWALAVITALRDSTGRHIGFAKVTRDISEQRRQEESARQLAAAALMASEERFASFAQHLPGLAWIKGLDGRYTYINDAAVVAFGSSRDAIIGRRDEEIFPPTVAAEFRRNDHRALESWTGIQVIELLPDAGGGLRHSIVSKFPIADADGQFHLIGGVAIDITDRVRAEEALHEADRHKTEFLATLSHELRNPLAPIRNSVHLLRTESTDLPRDRIYRILDQQLNHLVRLVDDLLELSRVSSGKVALRVESVDLNAVLQTAADTSGPLIANKHHQLHIELAEAPVMVQGDSIRLVQVVANLLNNAAKYTPDSGQIGLTLRREGVEGVITVRDSGLGIPDEMLPRVFDMFTQVDQSLHRSQGGLGIGLALARSLVELHGGQIAAQSRGAEQGSEFTVRLPVADANDQRRDSADRSRPSAPPRRVLVVDDNRDAADSLALILGTMGAEARSAYNGPSALELVRSWAPTVVLLDLGMPGMDGYVVAYRIRQDPAIRGVRLIALTGWGSADDRRHTSAAGFDEHWVKPVDPAQLREMLASPAPVRPS